MKPIQTGPVSATIITLSTRHLCHKIACVCFWPAPPLHLGAFIYQTNRDLTDCLQMKVTIFGIQSFIRLAKCLVHLYIDKLVRTSGSIVQPFATYSAITGVLLFPLLFSTYRMHLAAQ